MLEPTSTTSVGQFQVLVAAGHGVGAEGALVAGHRRGHAQARIGVDVGAADEALHQLVGDVIILRQQLAGDVKGDRVRAMFADDARETVARRHPAPCPSRTRSPRISRVQQALVVIERFAQRRALGAQAAEVGGMLADRRERRTAPSVGHASPARRSRRRSRDRWCG